MSFPTTQYFRDCKGLKMPPGDWERQEVRRHLSKKLMSQVIQMDLLAFHTRGDTERKSSFDHHSAKNKLLGNNQHGFLETQGASPSDRIKTQVDKGEIKDVI